MVPETKTRSVNVTKYRSEERTRTYTVTKCVPETKTRSVSVTKYRPEERTRNYTVTTMVPEERTRTYTVTKMVPEQKSRSVNVTKYRTESKTREYTVTRCVPETMTKEVSYTVMVPSQKEESYTVTVYDCVPETKTQSYTVRVPHTVTKEVPVQKCVTVAVEVPVENACGGCGDAGSAGDCGGAAGDCGGCGEASACDSCGGASAAACGECGGRRRPRRLRARPARCGRRVGLRPSRSDPDQRYIARTRGAERVRPRQRVHGIDREQRREVRGGRVLRRTGRKPGDILGGSGRRRGRPARKRIVQGQGLSRTDRELLDEGEGRGGIFHRETTRHVEGRARLSFPGGQEPHQPSGGHRIGGGHKLQRVKKRSLQRGTRERLRRELDHLQGIAPGEFEQCAFHGRRPIGVGQAFRPRQRGRSIGPQPDGGERAQGVLSAGTRRDRRQSRHRERRILPRKGVKKKTVNRRLFAGAHPIAGLRQRGPGIAPMQRIEHYKQRGIALRSGRALTPLLRRRHGRSGDRLHRRKIVLERRCLRSQQPHPECDHQGDAQKPGENPA